jgi:hypothetical protein
VIHVATVHWRSDRWIDIQRHYLDAYLDGPYRAYAFLNDVPGDHRDKFFYLSTEKIRKHATKLNLLCDVIRFAADDPSDLLVVIDGDAFPVGPLAPLIEERLPEHRLIAVHRYENNRDPQPHPCFCVTTVGFWSEVGGDWHKGYDWADPGGDPITDVGGNLLAALEREGVDWYRLRRVNRVNPHPLFFALYGDERYGPVVYHHGAGFREAAGRVTRELHGEREIQSSRFVALLDVLARKGPGPVRRLSKRHHPVTQLRRELKQQTKELSAQMLDRIRADDEFWRELA